MSWKVQLNSPIYIYSQLNSPTYDGSHPTNEFYLNCGETCLAMVTKHLRDVFVSPDLIHDQILSDGKVSTTTETQLGDWLQNYCNISTSFYYPTEGQNAAKSGLFDTIWSYLYSQEPLIVLGDLNLNGTHYNHWRVVVGLDDTFTVTLLDPWYGSQITMTHDQFWNDYRGILIGIDTLRPPEL